MADALRPADGRLFLAGSRYQVAAEMAFYVRGNPTVFCPSTDRGPKQYDDWSGLESLVGWNALYVNADGGPIDPGVARRFAAVEVMLPLVVRRHGWPIRVHAVFHLRGYRGPEPDW